MPLGMPCAQSATTTYKRSMPTARSVLTQLVCRHSGLQAFRFARKGIAAGPDAAGKWILRPHSTRIRAPRTQYVVNLTTIVEIAHLAWNATRRHEAPRPVSLEE